MKIQNILTKFIVQYVQTKSNDILYIILNIFPYCNLISNTKSYTKYTKNALIYVDL